MRGKWNHFQPEATQLTPADNTTVYVDIQCAEFARTGTLIHPEIALEIASWFHTPTNAFCDFSHSGTVTDELCAEISEAREDAESPEIALALAALSAYVLKCEIPVWVTGHNLAGYLPESPVSTFIDYAAALEDFRSSVENTPETHYADELCECDDTEACGICVLAADAAAYLATEAPHVTYGKVYGEARELSFTVSEDDMVTPEVYWLTKSTRVVADYLAETLEVAA